MARPAQAAFLLLAFLNACAHFTYPETPALERWDKKAGYRLRNLALEDGNTDSTFVVVTLSGGGTRAAAFAYGVLQSLASEPIAGRRTLLDEVDVISSVSGGSFAAAYYGLFEKQHFLDHFPKDVLHRKIERDYFLRILAPWNWLRLLSPRFARSDLAAAYYGKHIYRNVTYGDLPARRPFIVINAADMSLGAQFSFTQEHFDRLCADVSKVELSRAVAASSAFPIVFTPLTLENRPKSACGYPTPTWVALAERDLHVNPTRYDLAKTWKAYEDAEVRPYIHLVDGGIADNIGLRGPANAITTTDSSWSILRKVGLEQIDRLAIIAVDAKPGGNTGRDEWARPPWFVSVLQAAATKPMENYSADTIELMRQKFEEWRAEKSRFDARRKRCDDFAPTRKETCYAALRVRGEDWPSWPEVYQIHVRFEAIEDPSLRERVERISTRLQLSDDEVELLIDVAGQLLAASPDYSQLLADLREPPEGGDR